MEGSISRAGRGQPMTRLGAAADRCVACEPPPDAGLGPSRPDPLGLAVRGPSRPGSPRKRAARGRRGHEATEVLQKTMRSFNQVSSAPGGASKGEEKLPEPAEESQVLHGTGHCKWFNVRMGFGFISMINREGNPLDIPVDVFVHQSKLFMEGFRSLKEGEPVEFTFKKSPKGLESIRVTGPGGSPCLGGERRPKGKTQQKRKPKGDRWRRQDLLMDQMWTVREEESRMIPRCYNCGGLDHHAKECSLPPQPKKCHYCQSIKHMVANCPHRIVAQPPTGSQGRQEAESQPCTSASPREMGGGYGCMSPSPFPEEASAELAELADRSPQEVSSLKAPEEQTKKGPSIQKRKKT